MFIDLGEGPVFIASFLHTLEHIMGVFPVLVNEQQPSGCALAQSQNTATNRQFFFWGPEIFHHNQPAIALKNV